MENKSAFNILLVDDDELVHLTATTEYSACSDLLFSSARSGEEALELIKSNPNMYAVMLLDYEMGTDKLDGASAAEEILKVNPDQIIVASSANDTREALKRTFKSGIVDFLEKTIPTTKKVEIIRKYCKQYKEHLQNASPVIIARKNQALLNKAGMIGNSKELIKVARDTITYAEHNSNVLVRGETGTGKELVARAIHTNSKRAHRPFIAINCGAIPRNLIESELFGHAKGSFTGAVGDKKGKFLEANGGTIFLDEIGDMPYEVQVKLLRVLQEGMIEPIGKLATQVDVRIIAATHVDIEEKIKSGDFREDLFFRLNVLDIKIPPLRERLDDIKPLLFFFAQSLFTKERTFTEASIKKLMSYTWPGNIRQLQTVLKRLDIIAGDESKVRPEFITNKLLEATSSSMGATTKVSVDEIESVEELNSQIQILEKSFWQNQLTSIPNIKELAAFVKIPKASLYRKLSNLGIDYKSI